MTLKVAGESLDIIVRVGRWRFLTYMTYIHAQIDALAKGLAWRCDILADISDRRRTRATKTTIRSEGGKIFLTYELFGSTILRFTLRSTDKRDRCVGNLVVIIFKFWVQSKF